MELNKKTLRNIFLGVAGCILLYWLLHETERLKVIWGSVVNVLSPFLVGAALAFVLNVPMRAIERLLRKIKKDGLRRALAIVLTLLVVALVLTGVIWLLVPQLIDTLQSLIATIPAFIARVQNNVMGFLNDRPQILEWLQNNTSLQDFNWQSLIERAVDLASNSVTVIFNTAVSLVVELSTGIFNAVLSIVFAIYCLGRKEILARQGRRLVYSVLPEKAADEVIRILRMTNASFSNFISGQGLEALILGAMFAVSMLIFGMPYIPLISVIISVTALVPIVGAFVGCFIGAFFILMQNPTMAFWFVIMFLVLQQIEGNLIYPRVVGTSIGLPGMWVLVAVAIGGDIMGVGGMLLMIPLAAVVYALLREFTDKRVAAKGIPRDKLQAHPPELKSGFKKKREQRKAKKNLVKNAAKEQTEKETDD
ncbi:MAG: AI-2E family transporter [Ruminococcaceae bacterium]|nr:AI-2E family transporter [Oscillospiraceae bacterium]